MRVTGKPKARPISEKSGLVKLVPGGAAGKVALLLDADGAVDAVDRHDDLQRQAARHGDRELVARHQETAVADHAHHGAARFPQRGSNRGRDAEAHRPGDRSQQALRRGERDDAVGGRREAAGIEGQDRVGRQMPGHGLDHGLEWHAVGDLRDARGGDAPPLGSQAADPCGPVGRRRAGGAECRQQGSGCGGDGEVGREVRADHRRIGVHVRQPQRPPCRVGEAVALGGDVRQARAQDQQQVGVVQHGHLRGRVLQPHVAGIERVRVVEQVLAAEADQYWQVPGFGKGP